MKTIGMKWPALVACLLAPTLALAQFGFDKPPAPAPAAPLQVPGFANAAPVKLANGLALVVVERHAVPLVTALLLIDGAGSLSDPAGKAGLASMSVTLMSKGSQRGKEVVDAAGIAHAAEALGGSLETGAGAQASRIAMTVATNRLDASLALLADVARRPTFPDEELERSRAQELDNIKLSLSDPGMLGALLARRVYWGDTSPGQLATPATLARIKREDVLAFHQRQLRPDRVTLVLAGDIEPAQARTLADKYFGNWAANKMLVRPGPVQAPKPLAQTLLVDLPGAGQSAVTVIAPYAPQGNEPLQRAALRAGAVAQAVLGVGYSSRVNQEIRIKRGLSYGAFAAAENLPGGGMLSASAQTKHASAAEVAGLLKAEVLKLASEDVPAAELQARELVLVGEFGRALETTATLAGMAADQIQRGRDPADLPRYPTELLAVDAARVKAFAAEYWKPDAMRTVVVADLSVAGDGLRKQFPDAWVIKAGDLDLGSATLRRPLKR